MDTLHNISTDSVPVVSSPSVSLVTADGKTVPMVTIHSHCSLCTHTCSQTTLNGVRVAPTPVEPKSVSCQVLEGKYFSSYQAKVKHHIASLLRLSGVEAGQAERIGVLLGDSSVLNEITRSSLATVYEDAEGNKYATKEEARKRSGTLLKFTA